MGAGTEGTLRFDYLRPGGAGGVIFTGAEEVIEAQRLDQVFPALREVEAAIQAAKGTVEELLAGEQVAVVSSLRGWRAATVILT